jgi:cyclic-di-AMP phosphodiesterase PgpH
LAAATLLTAVALFFPLPSAIEGGWTIQALVTDELGAVLALALASAGFWALRGRFWSPGRYDPRRLRNGAMIVVLQALLLRTALELGHPDRAPVWTWWPVEVWLWVPWFLTTGLGAMLLGSRLGVLISLSGVLLLYLRADPGPLALIGCLVSSLAGIVLLRRSTRGQVLRAGAGAGALLGVLALIHGLQLGAPWTTVGVSGMVPLIVGVLSSFIILAFLPVIEWILGELSDVTLVEYGGDHPLLDELKGHAPGTWHHTLNVADLAEKAAAAIGARALFCRTAALYHDIGKLKEPGIFAENIEGASPHETMDPRVSAARIIEHVTHGLELARQHRLPKAFQDIIVEHHGLSMVRFFYTQACAQLREGETVDTLRPLFCYPGPPPTSRESGIISLSDAVEAATRSFAGTDAEARAFVRKLIADRVADGELAQCPLTLEELALVQSTFTAWVKARHHRRPAYPKAGGAEQVDASEWTKTTPEQAAGAVAK